MLEFKEAPVGPAEPVFRSLICRSPLFLLIRIKKKHNGNFRENVPWKYDYSVSLSLYNYLQAGFSFTGLARMSFELKVANKGCTIWSSPVVKISHKLISRYSFAEYVIRLCWSACRRCSTIFCLFNQSGRWFMALSLLKLPNETMTWKILNILIGWMRITEIVRHVPHTFCLSYFAQQQQQRAIIFGFVDDVRV